MRRADELSTKRDLLRAFLAEGSPRVIVCALLGAVVLRLAIGGWSWVDGAIAVGTFAAVGIVERLVHLHLLHAPEDSWARRVLGAGRGHEKHHLDPPDIEWLLLQRQDAFVHTLFIAVVSALWVVPAMLVLGVFLGGVGLLGPWATAVLCAVAALAHFESTHQLERSSYRPTSCFYRRLVRNHRLHHHRNEHYWLGVTSNLGDRVMGTYVDRSAVPKSETARSLT